MTALPDPPYLFMGPSRLSTWNAWLEVPRTPTGHAELVAVADRLCREFGAEVVERYPEEWSEQGKEYWTLQLGKDHLLLMRKPPTDSIGITIIHDGDIATLLRIAEAWGVERYIGWRWRLWWFWRRLRAWRAETPSIH